MGASHHFSTQQPPHHSHILELPKQYAAERPLHKHATTPTAKRFRSKESRAVTQSNQDITEAMLKATQLS